jgi:hypothetical protein
MVFWSFCDSLSYNTLPHHRYPHSSLRYSSDSLSYNTLPRHRYPRSSLHYRISRTPFSLLLYNLLLMKMVAYARNK